MKCEKCIKGRIVLHAFSYGECMKCKCEITTPHIPCDQLCEECSDKYKCCKDCGVDVK